ncbi:MAG: 1-phosphofructokinase family hexose kinase [Saprospiraceae bacterium]|nr:1-phosphofructokinase family hexose kinase [Saprospiraceae bacterium]
MAKIVTLTLNPALDKSTEVEKMIPEHKLRCSAIQMDAGGGGINVSKAIHELGGVSVAVFPCGGHNGNVLCGMLQEKGIQIEPLKVNAETRENLAVRERSSNAQYRLTTPGRALEEQDADKCLESIRGLKPEYLVASGSLPPGLPITYYEKVASFAKEINAKFILDTSGEPLLAAADEGLYLLKPNLAELSALAGVSVLEMNQVDDAALDIIKQGKCASVVVSLGAQGALLVTRQGFEHIPAPLVKKQSTVGAGDSMVAGMVWALSEGKTYKQMAQIGVACGSAATINAGTELFHQKDVWRLLNWIEQYGERYRITDFSCSTLSPP